MSGQSAEFLKVTASGVHIYNCAWNDWRLSFHQNNYCLLWTSHGGGGGKKHKTSLQKQQMAGCSSGLCSTFHVPITYLVSSAANLNTDCSHNYALNGRNHKCSSKSDPKWEREYVNNFFLIHKFQLRENSRWRFSTCFTQTETATLVSAFLLIFGANAPK